MENAAFAKFVCMHNLWITISVFYVRYKQNNSDIYRYYAGIVLRKIHTYKEV